MNRRPLVALHRSTGTKTLVAGRNADGSTNAVVLVPAVEMAPSRCTTPEMTRAAGLAVPNGALLHPLSGVSGVHEVAFFANETPSSEVKHWASAKLFSGSTVTLPVGEISRRPLAELHMSTLTKTLAT